MTTAKGNSANACPLVLLRSMYAIWLYDALQLQEIIDKLNQLTVALQR
jgi:hypothetical protein